jgi:hypothetical protein
MSEEVKTKLTEEQKALQAESDKSFYILKAYIEEAVNGMYKLEIPLGFIEIESQNLFKNYQRIKSSKTKEWATFIEEKQAAEGKFYSLKASELTELAYEVPTAVEEEISAESLQ